MLTSNPLYSLFAVPMLITFLNKLEKEFKTFLWGHDHGKSALHPIAWSTIGLPKSQGGLGTMDLIIRRKACLYKLAVQIVLNPNSLWVRIVQVKYHFKDNWDDYQKPRSCSKYLIKNL